MKLLFSGRNRITSGYRLPDRPDHNGIDVVGMDSADILAPVDGVVTASTLITNHADRTWQWGNYVCLRDPEGNKLFFCHMASRAVEKGQTVKAGDKLGVMGNTGYSFGRHTHFEVRKNGVNLDPAAYLGMPNEKGTYAVDGWQAFGGKVYYYLGGKPIITDKEGAIL